MDILSLTGPIYLIIAAGYLAVRGGLFVLAEMRVLDKLVRDRPPAVAPCDVCCGAAA